jgi:hypothetical protein
MQADEPTLHHRSVHSDDLHLPLPPKSQTRRRPQNYLELLVWKLKNGPVRPTLCKRIMIPVRHFIVLLLVLFALGLLFLGLGYFLWRVVLPESYSAQSPDLNAILLGGWFIVVAIFSVGIFLSWMQTVIALFLCGKGLVRTLD